MEVLKKVPDYMTTKRNIVYYGVRELIPSEYNKYTETNRPPVPYQLVGNISTNYSVRMFFKSKLTPFTSLIKST